MRRTLIGNGIAIGALFLGLGFAVPASAAPADKVTICHRTAAVDNPYVELTTSANAIINAGHGSHTGPVFPATSDGAWGDVIPPFDYSGGRFPGLNWTTEGQAVVNAGCKVDLTPEPLEPTTTTTRPSEPTTTRPHEPTTTTTRPHVATTTSEPSPGTTSPPTPTTSPLPPPPPPVDPSAGQVETAPEEAVVIDPGGHTVVLGSLDSVERVDLKAELDALRTPPVLALTGSAFIVPALVSGTVLILMGAGLLSVGYRRRSRT